MLIMSRTYLSSFLPYFFLGSFAKEKLGMTYAQSLEFIPILNGIGFLGRILAGAAARYMGMMTVFIACVLSSALCIYAWILVSPTSGLYVWAVFYILAIGGVQSLFVAVVPEIHTDPFKIGARMGIILAAVGVGSLIGPPISGAIIAVNNGLYVGAQAISGSTLR